LPLTPDAATLISLPLYDANIIDAHVAAMMMPPRPPMLPLPPD